MAGDGAVFTAASLGTTTAGSFTLYFDGSDVDLTDNGADVDVVELPGDGRLSYRPWPFTLPGASGDDHDVAAFTPTSLGASTQGRTIPVRRRPLEPVRAGFSGLPSRSA